MVQRCAIDVVPHQNIIMPCAKQPAIVTFEIKTYTEIQNSLFLIISSEIYNFVYFQ